MEAQPTREDLVIDDTRPTVSPEAAAGAAVYSRFVLALYDLEVLKFELPVVFKCPSSRIAALYDRHVADRHLDVGVGTGYFLDGCRFPVAKPEVHLMDLNPTCLETTSRRIARYAPVAHRCNVLEPIRLPLPRFGSIAMSNLLHCLPGSLREKEPVLRHLKPFLREDGVLFGVTVLGEGVDAGPLYRYVNRVYNRKAIFSNLRDNAADLATILSRNFASHTVEVVGSLAFFTGRG
jgi:SAM-dependent methyltransferase